MKKLLTFALMLFVLLVLIYGLVTPWGTLDIDFFPPKIDWISK